ncbi:MAG: NUDIX hydrolase [Gemmatimonadota bacterium]|nr:NUDIX hydrolase [Gemmatimonadota bacterium]
MSDSKQTAWKCLRTTSGPDLKLFRVRFDWLKNPRNAHTVKATVLESSDWTNVVALTPEEKVVVVHQHRFGTGQTTTEIPAGIVEAGETSREASVRELKEETGYVSDDWEYLGYVEPNPAFLDNRCHHWVARNAVLQSAPEPDKGEDVAVSELSLDEIRQEIAAGRFRHSLAFTGLMYLFDLRPLLRQGE